MMLTPRFFGYTLGTPRMWVPLTPSASIVSCGTLRELDDIDVALMDVNGNRNCRRPGGAQWRRARGVEASTLRAIPMPQCRTPILPPSPCFLCGGQYPPTHTLLKASLSCTSLRIMKWWLKMIIKGRSPTMRHVSRTHRAALDWLFDRMNLDPKKPNQIHRHQTSTRRHVDKGQFHTWRMESSFVSIQH